ncbi:MAG: site-specific integrase [Blautia sp.]|nr:site-specific integrase [Blautia sp.]
MKIEKLPSGSYRIRKMYKGQVHAVITDYKPTQKEALKLMADELDRIKPDGACRKHLTFLQAAESYIDIKKNVLSPSTVAGYRRICRALSSGFTGLLVSDISVLDVQKEINGYSAGRSPKTVRNAHGFISAVLSMYRPEISLRTTLPQRTKPETYVPTDDEVRMVVEYAKGTEYEIPVLLASLGLRRSEICALTISDLDGCRLRINKALVENSDHGFTEKGTKTTDSAREIYLPDELAALIRSRGHIYKGYPGNILKFLHRAQDALGIPRFKLHALRHYYASTAHAIGIPDSYIMQSGGWQSDNVLKNVYRHALDSEKEKMQKQAAEYITGRILS